MATGITLNAFYLDVHVYPVESWLSIAILSVRSLLDDGWKLVMERKHGDLSYIGNFGGRIHINARLV